ncbi:MAG TPA: hypothetical protein VLC09_01515, partial [Polyangiaceae bacterium]|nr:hypothetical protein [Polyangiaceae bacterium]
AHQRGLPQREPAQHHAGRMEPSGLELSPRSLRPAAAPARYVAPAQPNWLRALSPALALLVLSIALTLLDRAFSASRGEPLSFGPVRASWIAAGIMIAALVNGFSAVRRVLR